MRAVFQNPTEMRAAEYALSWVWPDWLPREHVANTMPGKKPAFGSNLLFRLLIPQRLVDLLIVRLADQRFDLRVCSAE